MFELTKSCCGCMCIVADSDKCCYHEERLALKAINPQPKLWRESCKTRWERRTYRYRCAVCRNRQPWLDFWYQAPLRPCVVAEMLAATDVNTNQKFPPLVPAVYKPSCGHSCRNGLEQCCHCHNQTETLPYEVCDCCLDRQPHPYKPPVQYVRRYRLKTRTKNRNSFPDLNFSLNKVHEMCLDDRSAIPWETEEGEGSCADPQELLSVEHMVEVPWKSQPPCETDTHVNLGDERNWPSLGTQMKPSRTSEAFSRKDDSGSFGFVVEETLAQASDHWEVLSETGSVWAFESIMGESETENTGKSFRDVVLTRNVAEAEPGTCRSIQTNPSSKHGHHPTSHTFMESLVKGEEDDDDLLASLRDDYKGGRGGNSAKMFHRERKGKAPQKDTPWDTEGRLLQRQKVNRFNRRICKRVVSNR